MTIYNEFDPFAAAWLRELIADRLIANGTVDARDIRDITPTELVGHRQVHLFAGIGVWSAALRLAGVSDDQEVWTASCPCQPFSAAGKRGGTADERHLWPAAFHLIRHCRPRVVMGEQVASPDGLAWLDLVLADLEGEGYTVRAADTCAAGFGAPHIRQRLYWLAYTRFECRSGRRDDRDLGEAACWAEGEARQRERLRDAADDGCGAERLADHADERHERIGRAWGRRAGSSDGGHAVGLADRERGGLEELEERDGGPQGRREAVQRGHDALRCGEPERLGDADIDRPQGRLRGRPNPRREALDRSPGCDGSACRPGPTNGLWRDPDWLLCRDAKWRPVESGTFPLADAGAFRNRVGALRGAGNAINLAQAAAFIRANDDLILAAIERHEETPNA